VLTPVPPKTKHNAPSTKHYFMSSDVVIRVENLGKLYRIGQRGTHADDLRHRLNSALTYPVRRLKECFVPRASLAVPGASCLVSGDEERRTKNEEQSTTNDEQRTLWALRDVSFEVKQGEILGIIGRNGAGKSTLLKILSRITEPTTGRVEMKGRLAALLEVGTGFHPELTGRENVYLNGMILGMTKPEIDREFDAIVDFSGVEKFIDTPVKRYSSGMHVRLGFAVAAHLRPEILVVDEVLAVGDIAFQERCMGKLNAVSREGRTVIFVSHNMRAITTVCSRCILIRDGILDDDGDASDVVIRYQLAAGSQETGSSNLEDVQRIGNGKAQFTSLEMASDSQHACSLSSIATGEDLRIDVEIVASESISNANVAVTIHDAYGVRLIDVNTALQNRFLCLSANQRAAVQFILRNVLLAPGIYVVALWLGRPNEDIDAISHAGRFTVHPRYKSLVHTQEYPGLYQCDFEHFLKVEHLS